MPISHRIWYGIADSVIYPLLCYVIRYRKHIVVANLKASFPDKTDKEINQLVRRFYRHFAHILVEIMYGRNMSGAEMQTHVEYVGVERLAQLTQQYGGVMGMLAHLGNWEWLANIGYELSLYNIASVNVYRKLKNKFFDQWMHQLRARRGDELAEKKQILRAMVSKRKTAIPTVYGMIADQKPSPTTSQVQTTFLNQPTPFLDGTELLARKFNYPVVYVFITMPRRGYYRADIQLITEHPQEESEGFITRRYAELLEQNIRQAPELWLWTHNRWRRKK